ncbi:MAG: ribose-phosphate diphosphokinase [Candidatus Thorarchaeota archaeon]
MTIVTSGSPSKMLAWRVAQQLKAKYVDTDVKQFPDGETYVRFLDEVAKEDVVIIQSLGHRPNDYLIELFLMLDALKDLKTKRIVTILPYFAYARQDERFKPGEAISLKTISRLIEAAGADYIFTIDSHRHRVVDQDELTTVPLADLTAMAELAHYMNSKYELKNPAIVGPDTEAGAWAKIAADALSVDYDALEKKRFDAQTVEIKPRSLDLEGRDVLIVDDIISTGNTIIKAIGVLKNNGARDIYVACTHPLLVLNALSRIYQAGALDVVGTDTVSSTISLVSVAPVITKAINKIM